MPNPYLLNITGLVLEIIGVVYIVAFILIMTTGNDKFYSKVVDTLLRYMKPETNPLRLLERGLIKIGLFFVISGLVFQIYANYIQGRC